MTVLIISLFTPYTVHFDGHFSTTSSSPPVRSDSKPFVLTLPQQQHVDENESNQSQHGRSQSLTHTPTFVHNFSTRSTGIPKTPGATTDLEQIFLPRDSKRPLSLILPSKDHAGNRSTTSLHTFAAIDSQAASWGKTIDFKQPKSRAKSPPNASILSRDNSCHPEKKENSQSTKHARFAPSVKGTPPAENEFPYENYTVVPSVIGNFGLISAINAVSESGTLQEKTWVGTLGMPTDALSQSLKDEIAGTLEHEHESLCVFVNDSDLNGHYEHYCKIILWPILHYQIPDRPKSKAYQDRSWIYYLKVNEEFADAIVKNYKIGDIVWVHDYHLLLVPSLVRTKLPQAQIGFFLHTAFPSSEVYRVLPMRQQLLEGILGADMIGFQTDEYVEHFLQTCNRMLNVETTKDGLILESGRSINVFTFPIGIDVPSMEQLRDLQEVKDWMETIGEKYVGKKIMVARDKLDNVHGVKEKILAFEHFLEKHPEWRDHVVLIQIAPTTTEDKDLNMAINDVITRINSTYSTLVHQPIVFLRQDIDYSQYLALLSVAECLLVTGLREGMNLTSHEFVVCQDASHSLKPHAPIILSEFTGAASVLGSGASLVNPWHFRKVSEAIDKALVMDPSERKERWETMRVQIEIHDAETWYSSYMSSLNKAWTEHTTRDPSAVPRLSINKLRQQYLDTERRLLLIDYEGTLTPATTVNDTLQPTPKRVFDILNELIDDESNMVYVMSHRPASELELTFQQVPGLGLIAENGSFLRLADSHKWIDIVSLEHVQHWKGGVKTIMHYYEERIDGSEIEELESALIFRYPKASDMEYAIRQASECAHQINEVCCVQHVAAIPIEHGFFVSDAEVSKASAAKTILDNNLSSDKPQFVLAIGDSREDEHVFHWAHELDEEGVKNIFTVNVGQRSTEARATLTQGATAVLSTLEKLARAR